MAEVCNRSYTTEGSGVHRVLWDCKIILFQANAVNVLTLATFQGKEFVYERKE